MLIDKVHFILENVVGISPDKINVIVHGVRIK